MIASVNRGMIRVVLFCNLEDSKTTHTFEVFPFKDTIREQFVIASLYHGISCVVLVVSSTPRCCVVDQLPRNEEKFHPASSKSRPTIIVRISKISIELEF